MNTTEFLTYYPDFSVIDSHIIKETLSLAEECYCRGSPWKNKPAMKNQAIKLIAARFLSMRWLQTAEVVGAATSLASGSPGRSPTSQENDFSLTSYGRQYLEIRKRIPALPIVF